MMGETATAGADFETPQETDVKPQIATANERASDELSGALDARTTLSNSHVSPLSSPPRATSEMVWDIPVEVHVVLGGAKLSVASLMALQPGQVLDLNRKVGEPLEIVVNGKSIAKGEITMTETDENRFAIRLTELTGN